MSLTGSLVPVTQCSWLEPPITHYPLVCILHPPPSLPPLHPVTLDSHTHIPLQRMAMELAANLSSCVSSEEEAAKILDVMDTVAGGMASRDPTVVEHAVSCVSRVVAGHASRAVAFSKRPEGCAEAWHLQLLVHVTSHGVVGHLLRLLHGEGDVLMLLLLVARVVGRTSSGTVCVGRV